MFSGGGKVRGDGGYGVFLVCWSRSEKREGGLRLWLLEVATGAAMERGEKKATGSFQAWADFGGFRFRCWWPEVRGARWCGGSVEGEE
ncbi:hypothetical protein HAX54_008205 [Datura stramonium]|uniref:Uncharacterized protein n=1 Tax=Datura stramonium TaxID=4076 RepID=A0ABS8Y8G1_DATST|nr:hypothetical protein [Datura stramonium]